MSLEGPPPIPETSTPERSDPMERIMLEAIQANPNDDFDRHGYADWLEERGDPRAGLLRAEMVLRDLPPDDARRAELAARSAELREQVGHVDAAVFLANVELLPKRQVNLLPGNLAAQIAAGGYEYSRRHGLTPDRFPVTERTAPEPITVHLVEFGRNMSKEEIEAAVARMQTKQLPTTIEPLLALGAQHPEEQLDSEISSVGISTELYDDSLVPSLSTEGATAAPGRVLVFHPAKYRWDRHTRFVLVDKPANAAGTPTTPAGS